jgi:hypothetical protein
MEAEQLRILIEENRRLHADNARLRELLQLNNVDPNSPLPAKPAVEIPTVRVLPAAGEIADIESPKSKAEKITLFRSLFRGRDDVYAIRFQSRATGEWATRRTASMTGARLHLARRRDGIFL